jgi:hypothetical protein
VSCFPLSHLFNNFKKTAKTFDLCFSTIFLTTWLHHHVSLIKAFIDNQLYYTIPWEGSFGSIWVPLKQVQLSINPYSVSINIFNQGKLYFLEVECKLYTAYLPFFLFFWGNNFCTVVIIFKFILKIISCTLLMWFVLCDGHTNGPGHLSWHLFQERSWHLSKKLQNDLYGIPT